MTATTPEDLPGGDSALAGEYVQGLLEGAELHAFEARLGRDPALQAEVASWSAHLADLAAPLPEIAPAPAVLRRIEIAAFGSGPPRVLRQLWPYVLGAVAAAVLAWAAMQVGLVPRSGLAPEPQSMGFVSGTGAATALIPAQERATGQ